jgi:Zn-dependent membrane protease YugP
MAGMAEEYIAIAYAGVICFSLSTVFQLVTLPTEFNASRRAISTIESSGLLSRDEQSGAKRVLTAAALTYVAALAVSLVQLLRLLLIVGGSSRRRR